MPIVLQDDAEAVAAQEAPDRRSPEDLQMYETFFPELLEFEVRPVEYSLSKKHFVTSYYNVWN